MQNPASKTVDFYDWMSVNTERSFMGQRGRFFDTKRSIVDISRPFVNENGEIIFEHKETIYECNKK
jgi:hypothetical protein